MRITLLKCFICEYWYRPQARANHCPMCGCIPMKVSAHKTKHYVLNGSRLLEVVRGIPRTKLSHYSAA